MRRFFSTLRDEDIVELLPIPIILTFLFFFVVTYTNYRNISNVSIYVVGSLVFFICFAICVLFSEKVRRFLMVMQKPFLHNKVKWIFFAIAITYLYIGINISEPSLVNIRSILLFLCAIVFFLLYGNLQKVKKDKRIRILIALCLIVYNFYCLYMPNFFEDYSGGVHHVDAYTTSIINACNGYPYVLENSSTYGHQGIFFIPIVKLFDIFLSQWTAITLSVAVFGSLCLGLMLFIIDRITEDDFLFSLASLAVCYYSCYSRVDGNYYQMEPHRYLFQAITLFGCYFLISCKNKRFLKILMWGIISLATLWNLETGIVSVIVWTVCCICEENKEKWKIGSIIKNIFLALAAILVSYLVVCLYNISVGGKAVDFLTFVYPIGESLRELSPTGLKTTFDIETLGFGIRLPIDWWFIIYAVLISYFVVKCPKVFFHKTTDKDIIGISGALMALGTFVYYMNEPWNECKFISIYGLIIVCILTIQGIRNSETKRMAISDGNVVKIVGRSLSIFLLCFFAVSSLLAIPQRLIKLEAHTHNEESLDCFLDGVSAKIPQDTAFIGKGAPQLCALLDRRNVVGYMDEPDMTLSGLDYAQKDIDMKKYPYILMDKDSRIIELVQDYSQESEFDYYDFEGNVKYSFVLYRRKVSVS